MDEKQILQNSCYMTVYFFLAFLANSDPEDASSLWLSHSARKIHFWADAFWKARDKVQYKDL